MTSFTQSLRASEPQAYERATRSPFLTSAARGETPKPILSKWLANDRLYIHAYIAGTGRLLSQLPLPSAAPMSTATHKDPATRILDWVVSALNNIRREEKFFLTTAERFGLDVNLPTVASANGIAQVVPSDAKLEGLRRWEKLFHSLAPGPEGEPLPWLEGAVLFWGTEICYLDAWTGVRDGLLLHGAKESKDADDGALRHEFIPNWTNDEFVAFVNNIRDIIDDGVEEAVKAHGEDVREKLLQRAKETWKAVLAAEENFWPEMS